MVTSLNPTVVHFIDFGIDETLIKDAELKDLGELKSPIITKIRLPQGISDKYRNLQRGDKISVRMLFVDSEKTIIVEIKEVQPVATDTTLHATESASSNATKKFVSQENSEATSKNLETNGNSTDSEIVQIKQELTPRELNNIKIENCLKDGEIELPDVCAALSEKLMLNLKTAVAPQISSVPSTICAPSSSNNNSDSDNKVKLGNMDVEGQDGQPRLRRKLPGCKYFQIRDYRNVLFHTSVIYLEL
ncbi:PREDICTED: uncharacterized protein LOC105451427 [Wasmannia auropunctata]|uniref:uncharacterized protein LOC105451427 n=1 Tax=Wasmannia auropunctata TaxID=64793 RepID=UPI0005F0ACE9|nr:PREDICTED: uncharacterized protein LOC105451427 [Wasmannia auropunctata]